MPLHMRIPKRGFNNIFAKDYAEVNLGLVQKAIDAGKLDASQAIDHAALKVAGLARGGKHGVRLLGKGEWTAKAQFDVAGVSKGAREAIEQAGGKITLPEPKVVKPAKVRPAKGLTAAREAKAAAKDKPAAKGTKAD